MRLCGVIVFSKGVGSLMGAWWDLMGVLMGREGVFVRRGRSQEA